VTGKALLTLHELSWRYEETHDRALDNIHLNLHEGEVVGVVGPSGAGKTTLLLALAGMIPANYAGDFSGSRQASGEVGVVFQDPETQFIGLTVEEEIAFALENAGYGDDEIKRRIAEVLQLVGLEGFSKRSPFELSGGEKQRVAIASALAASPQILLLDEPTSELDPKGAREVFALLWQLKRERNMTIVVSSHATEELARFCDRMLLISSGTLACDLPTAEFFSRPDELAACGVYVPDMIQLYFWLQREGMIEQGAGKVPLTVEEMLRLYQEMPRKMEVGR
jgi:energy-coupling factor transport system ATP-binding protein